MKKLLLTGATGFIGRHCIPFLLESGYEIHAVSSSLSKDFPSIHWHQTDLLDPLQSQRLLKSVQPSHLLHLAWYAIPGKFWNAKENLDWLTASIHLLKQFVAIGGKRAVFAGTCAEYEWNNSVCSEFTTPLTPKTLYGACKTALHSVAKGFTAQEKISFAWGRIFHLYGPHEHPKRLVSSIIRSLLQQESAPCSLGNQIRDFMHVEDVANALTTILNSDLQGDINIASGISISIKDVIRKIGEKTKRSDLIQWGKIPTSLNDPNLLLANTERLQKELKWQPKMDLDCGLDQTISWWKKELQG